MTISLILSVMNGRCALDQQILGVHQRSVDGQATHVAARFGSYPVVSGFLLSACPSSACHPQNAVRSKGLLDAKPFID